MYRIRQAISNLTASDAPEQSIGFVSDYKVGDKREVKVGEVTVLVVCTTKGFFALGHKCTHYGAPLVNGVLDACRIKCPWHGAVFSVDSGDVEEAPALDALPSYPITASSDGQLFIKVPQTDENKSSKRKHIIPSICVQDPPILKRKFLIVGGGAAGLSAAETLREAGFQGDITIVSADENLPYDRTLLSKNPKASQNMDKITLRPASFFKDLNIKILLRHKVNGIDTKGKTVRFETGQPSLSYDQLLLVTGSSSRKLGLKGEDLPHVHYIRSATDAQSVAASLDALKPANVVIIGSGFIGMEQAAKYIKEKELVSSVTVVDVVTIPFSRQLGDKLGNALKGKHEAEGVKFRLSTHTQEFVGDSTGVKEVVLTDGTRLPATIVIIAVGAKLNTEFLQPDPTIQLEKDGSIVVDEYFQHPSGVFAAGDIATFPYFARKGAKVRIEHWSVAQQMGRYAAFNMLGKVIPERYVPYFWTVQYGSIRYVGNAYDFDDVLIDGDLSPATLKFVAFFTKGEEILAVATFMRDPIASQAAELIRLGRLPTKSELKEKGFDLTKHFATA